MKENLTDWERCRIYQGGQTQFQKENTDSNQSNNREKYKFDADIMCQADYILRDWYLATSS